MVKIIHKFPFVTSDELLIDMPEGSQLLSIQMQHGQPCLWALVIPSAPTVVRRIHIHGTGHLIRHPYGQYIDTYQLEGGMLVFHAFDMGECT